MDDPGCSSSSPPALEYYYYYFLLLLLLLLKRLCVMEPGDNNVLVDEYPFYEPACGSTVPPRSLGAFIVMEPSHARNRTAHSTAHNNNTLI